MKNFRELTNQELVIQAEKLVHAIPDGLFSEMAIRFYMYVKMNELPEYDTRKEIEGKRGTE